MVKVTPVKASDVADSVGVPLMGPDLVIDRICPVVSLSEGALAFLQNDREDLVDAINRIRRVFIIAAPACKGRLQCSHILVPDPRLTYARVAARFFEGPPSAGICRTAIIDPSARLGQRVRIGSFSVIGPDVEIGDDTQVDAHVVVQEGTRIGHRCRISPHVVIGEPFGYDFDDKTPVPLPQFGAVCIGDDVRIDSHASIARGTLDDTWIGNHVKIGSQVRIAHNCRVDEGTLIISGTCLCGSVRVGRHVWIGAGALVLEGGIAIGDDALIGAGAVVGKTVPERAMVSGNPARVFRMRKPEERF